MPRDSNGNYSLPAGNPVAAGEIVDADWANTTMEDIRDALNDSLSRSGDGGMLVPLLFSDGTETAPGIAWVNEPSSGFYREDTGDMRVTILAGKRWRWLTDGTFEWNAVAEEWRRVVASNNITVNDDGSIVIDGPIDLGDDVTYDGDDLATYISNVAGADQEGNKHRYWSVLFGPQADNQSIVIDTLLFYKFGSAFSAGQRWNKGVPQEGLVTAGMVSSDPPGSTITGGSVFNMFQDSGVATFGATGSYDTDARGGVAIDFGEGNEQGLTGMDITLGGTGLTNCPEVVILAFSDDGVTYTDVMTVSNVHTFTGADADDALPHFAAPYDAYGSSDDTDLETFFGEELRTVPEVTGGGGGPDTNLWEFELTPRQSSFIAEAGKYYFVRNDFELVTITLPASPVAGDIVGIRIMAGQFGTPIIQSSGSDLIENSSFSDWFIPATLNTEHVVLIWLDAALPGEEDPVGSWTVFLGDIGEAG